MRKKEDIHSTFRDNSYGDSFVLSGTTKSAPLYISISVVNLIQTASYRNPVDGHTELAWCVGTWEAIQFIWKTWQEYSCL